MKNLLLFISILFGSATPAPNTNTATEPTSTIVESVNSSFSRVELNVREAAVKVLANGGHGSGSYLVHKGFHFVLTAQHVADGPLGKSYVISKNEEIRSATLVYSSPADDIAVLMISKPFRYIEPIKYKPVKSTAQVGDEIAYSGFPSSHKLMSIRGRVAGYENKIGSGKQIILHTYGWFGCSGSVIYNKKGEVVGVLWGVDVEYYPSMAIIEDMIWVVPIEKLDIQKTINRICKYNKLKFC